MSDNTNKPQDLSSNEKIKMSSNALRGTIAESLTDEITGNIRPDDQPLVRFHGMYLQDDRDRREERAAKKLERLYSFMIRLRLTGGFLSGDQWIALHHIAGENSTGTLKITTRQTIQLHGVLKTKAKPTVKAFNQAGLTTLATCGDINRNVICSAHPKQSPLHEQIFQLAKEITDMLLPKTQGYYEIWLDAEKIADTKMEEDLLYQDRYMPRKFKIALVIPPNNDIDVFGNDLGLIAVIEKDQLKGFNIVIGGGMSSTHGNPEHYPRLASELGYVDITNGKENLLKAIYELLTIQRDYGNRSDRKKARLKYTVDKYGIPWWKAELEKRAGFALEDIKPYVFNRRKDFYGWEQNHEGLWYYTVFVENGRVLDTDSLKLKQALQDAAKTGKVNFRFTCNQNVIISDIKPEDKAQIQEILEKYKIIEHTNKASTIRANAMACVALNTCALALAESQRYLPSLLDKVEGLLEKHGLSDEEMIVRMTGCPNGCARPFIAEIGFVGTALGKYNMYIGGDRFGMRLNKLYKESLEEPQILDELDGFFGAFAKKRKKNQAIGDFLHQEYCQ